MGVPSSTYRLQITPSFDLNAAAELVGYLDTLGAGAVYCSPLLQSASGSSHGYDVVDPTRIDLARGGASGWRALVESARSAGHGQGLVVDIVPNHLGVADASENPAWWDVLRLGPASPYAAWFDIERGSRRLLIPVLGDDFDADRDLSIVDGELRYHDHRFPIAPGTQGGSPAEVHDRQHYELVDHRRASVELTHRRFFAITTLAGVRVEDPEVFEATHRQVLRWTSARRGRRAADRPPGRAGRPARVPCPAALRAPDAWITVEKILQPGERLPAWPVSGTTGYDALAEVSAVLVDPAAAASLRRDLPRGSQRRAHIRPTRRGRQAPRCDDHPASGDQAARPARPAAGQRRRSADRTARRVPRLPVISARRRRASRRRDRIGACPRAGAGRRDRLARASAVGSGR